MLSDWKKSRTAELTIEIFIGLIADLATDGLFRYLRSVKYLDEVGDVMGAKKITRSVTRTLDELAPNGTIPLNTIENNKFHKWFDDLSSEELDLILADKNLSKRLADRIRWPGERHEWCMVCHIKQFKEWNVPISEVHRFRTLTEELKWVVPNDIAKIGGQVGKHGGTGSGTFHNELKKLIEDVNTLEEFNSSLTDLISRWSIDPKLLPHLIKSNL